MTNAVKSSPKRTRVDKIKIDDAIIIETPVLQVSKPADKELYLRSPDEFKDWKFDPDDVRAEARARRRKNKKQ